MANDDKQPISDSVICTDTSTGASECNNKFFCSKCLYTARRKSSWEKHNISKKHLLDKSLYKYKCETCIKTYKDKSGLWKHSKQCGPKYISSDVAHLTTVITGQNKIIEAQNKELVAQSKEIAELAKRSIANAGNNITNTNSNNNHFNLQIFLNETCKDALNLKDFVKSIIIELSDLKSIQTMGYTDGMSNIIVNALDSLDTNKRPIHCSDVKRETMYIKEGDVWEKENGDRSNVKDMIRSVEHKSIIKIPDWIKENPGCVKSNHKDNTTYLKMVNQVTGGDLQKNDENVDKIIHNIARKVVIDKTP